MKTKINVSLLLYFLFSACSSNEYIDNQKMMASIDAIDISKTIVKVAVDSAENILDTTWIEYLKYDQDNKKRYSKKIKLYGTDTITDLSYFRPDEDLFYSESFYGSDTTTIIYETKAKTNGTIVSSRYIYHNETIDTCSMDYTYEYHYNGKLKTLVVTMDSIEYGKGNVTIDYDLNEQPLTELVMMNDDTASLQSWTYSDSVLTESTYIKHLHDTTKWFYIFGRNKLVLSSKKYDFKNGKFIPSMEVDYFYNEENDCIRSIERQLDSLEVKYFKYLIR